MASNLPSNLHKHTAFRDKPYTHTINFPDGYPMPEQVTGELRRNGKIVPGISPAITVSGQSFTFTYPVEQLERISGLSDQYFLFDGIQMLGGQLNVMVGYGDPAVASTEVQIVDGAITVVQMDGVEVVAGLVTQVEQAASEVESNREQVAADAQTAASSAQTAINEAGVAQDAADGAIAAKNEAVSARTASQTAATQTAADRTQTGLDVLAATASKDAAAASAIEAAKNGVSGKTAIPSTVPEAGIEIYNVSQSGSYVNFNLQVDASDLVGPNAGLVQLRKENGVWKKVITKIPLDLYAQKSDLLTDAVTLAIATESGYYNELGVKAAALQFVRSASLIDVTAYDYLYYTGQMGGTSPVAVCWFNGSTFLSSQKLSPADGSLQTFSAFLLTKPATATRAGFTFRIDNNVPYSVTAKNNLYSDKQNTTQRLSALETSSLDTVKKQDLYTVPYLFTLSTETGYYNASGVKASSPNYTRSVNRIDIKSFDRIYYTGQMGGNAPVAICWWNESVFVSSQKLSPVDGTNQTFASFSVDKPAGVTHFTPSFRVDNSVPYSVSAASRIYATAAGLSSEISKTDAKIAAEVAKTDAMKLQTDQLNNFTQSVDTNILPTLENGYYNTLGVKVGNAAWVRTRQMVEITNFPVTIYDLNVYLTGGTASIIFYNSDRQIVTYWTNTSLRYTSAGERVLRLNELLTPEQKLVVKYINISSYTDGVSVVPSLKNKTPILLIAAYPEVVLLRERTDAAELVTKADSYNIGKAASANRSVLQAAISPKNPTQIPFGSASWWCYPSVLSVKRTEYSCIGSSDATFFSYVSSEGDQMIARITHPSANTRLIEHRCVSPGKAYPCDEHNVAAINMLSNNKIITAAAGHYDSTQLEVRIWSSWQDITPVIKLECGGTGISYAQILVHEANVMIFTRDAQFRWSVFISRNNGATWSARTSFLQGAQGDRAYMKVQKSTGGFAKVYWYPSADERANTFVRYMEIDMSTGEMLDKIGGNGLGNIYGTFTPIAMYTGGTLLFTNADIPDPVSGGNRRLRLLDTSGSTRNEAVFLVATLTAESATWHTNGDYRVISVALDTMAVTSIRLTDYGKEFFESVSDYCGGAFFEQSVSGERTGNIYLAKWGTAATTYVSTDAANRFRVEKWVNNAFNSLIEESTLQMFRPFTPQYFASGLKVKNVYMKGDYTNFNFYQCGINISEV